MNEAIIFEKTNHLAILTANRQQAMNAMNFRIRRELAQALLGFRNDKDNNGY